MHAKRARTQFHVSENKAENRFELMHCDIWGPYREPASCEAHYFLTIIDNSSRVVRLYLMKEKSEVGHYVKTFVSMINTQFDKCVKVIRTDNRLEFKSRAMKKFYAEKDIIHQTSCMKTPQQNGRVERKHQHVLNVARALCF